MRRVILFVMVALLLPTLASAQFAPRVAAVAQVDAAEARVPACQAAKLTQFGVPREALDALFDVSRHSMNHLREGEGQDAVPVCSGVDCGCDIAREECQAGCPVYPEPGSIQCTFQCGQAYRACAIACCGI